MSNRRRKRANRPETPPAAAAPRPAAPRPANRGTFAVAQANRQLADTLPEIVYNKPAARKAEPARPRVTSTPPLAVSAPPPNSAPRKAKPAPAPAARREGLSLDKLPTGCKPRPSTSKGDGSGRHFVPWCDKR